MKVCKYKLKNYNIQVGSGVSVILLSYVRVCGYIASAHIYVYTLWDYVYTCVLIEPPVECVLTSVPTSNCTDCSGESMYNYVNSVM